MKRTWKFLGLILYLALLLTIGTSGTLAQSPASPETRYVSGEVLVKFHGAPPGRSHGALRGAKAVEFANLLPAPARFAMEEIRGKAVRAFPKLGVLQVKLPPDLPVPEALEMLKRSGAAEHAEPNFLFFACPKPAPAPIPVPLKNPNDEYFGIQWALNNHGQTIYQDWFLWVHGTNDADIDAPEAWNISTDGSETIVVVIDTGVDYKHSDLAANMWENPEPGTATEMHSYINDIHGINAIMGSGDPMDDNGHGTHCAGIIGAQGDNNIGVCGVNWTARIMALKFLNDQGSGDEAAAIECIEYALYIKKKYGYERMVMSNSWGSYSKPEDQSSPVFLGEAISTAGQAGVIFVAAAGNDGANIDMHPFYPAGYALDNIIAVGASDEDDKVSFFNFSSNYGPKSVDLFAPGTYIASTYLTNSIYGPYVYLDGTSMAAPHVSGAAALVWSRSQGASFSTSKSLILNNVDKKRTFSNKCVTGGRLNLYKALNAAKP